MGTDERRKAAELAVSLWRDKLVNLSGTNRLLNFKVTKSSTVSITVPSIADVMHRLNAPKAKLELVALRQPAREVETDGEIGVDELDEAIEPEAVTSASEAARVVNDPATLGANHEPKVLSTALSTLLRSSNQTLMDTGLWTLYLALGTLSWSDPVDPKTVYRSPLVLWPVVLTQPGRRMPPVLTISEDEPVLNPALSLKLATLDFAFPSADDLSPEGLVAYLDSVQRAVAGRQGWTITDEVYLSYFTFHKEAMYRDIQDNLDKLLDSELVVALATSGLPNQTDEYLFEATGDELIDEVDPPEKSLQVLDADSSQRAAIAAAIEGKSFVLDGPPGTGKSQTISNIIASLIPMGKSVLFVSEKIAALEVVKNRLDHVGLGHFVLELHSNKATRKEVATELSNAVQTKPRAASHMADTDRKRLATTRNELSAYAAAMNIVRQPLDISLHDALGMVSKFADLPASSPCQDDLSSITSDDLAAIRQSSAALARAWRPASQGKGFLWMDVIQREPMDFQLSSAIAALEDLKLIAQPFSEITQAFGWSTPRAMDDLVAFFKTWSTRPSDIPDSWLVAESISGVSKTSKAAIKSINDTRLAQERALSLGGKEWTHLPVDEPVLPLDRIYSRANSMKPALTGLVGLSVHELQSLITQLSSTLSYVQELQDTGMKLAKGLGLLAPTKLADLDAAVRIEELAHAQNRPEKEWLRTDVDQTVEAGITELKKANSDVQSARERAQVYFTEGVLNVNPTELRSRFANIHTGIHKLGGAYRADVKTLAGVSQPGKKGKDNITAISSAVAWKEAIDKRAELENKYSSILGPRYDKEATDWDGLSDALDNARTIADVARASVLDSLMNAVGHGSQPNPELIALRESTSNSLQALNQAYELAAYGTANKVLPEKPLHDQEAWIKTALDVAGEALDSLTFADQVLKRANTFKQAREAWEQAQAARKLEIQLDEKSGQFQSVLESSFSGLHTDVLALADSVKWAESLRALIQSTSSQALGVLPDGILDILKSVQAPDGLAVAISTWKNASERVCAGFSTKRSQELSNDLNDWADGQGFLEDLLNDTAGQEEWFAYHEAMADLRRFGLEQVITSIAESRVSPSHVENIVEREVFKRWSDQVLAADPRVRRGLSKDRNALVDEFRNLDRQLVSLTVADVIDKTNSFRPSSTAGQVAILTAEGQRKTRHKPIRDLISMTRDVTQRIKPVFMMSPLSVSQYLSPDMEFDVVIFDEASQVMPEDAINSIYRGSGLIIAGDDKQLPPTNFFALADAAPADGTDDGSYAQDFESILSIAKGSGALNSLTLRWHYRSRHENLIAFSNNRFYEGNLVTFPSSQVEGPDVGVAFFQVENGIYGRGGSRNNIVEARFVAGRVEHHFDTRPDFSLGVVAFSASQADAIEVAIDELITRRPDLEDRFSGSRLDGFFVKNLESVQGDERDVMIFSIGYGPDQAGKFTMNFGPMNSEGGWRRLNVAVTRARYRNEIVASFVPGQINDSSQRGVAELKTYLDYAMRGLAALELSTEGSLGGPESPFEESVVSWLRSQGYLVTTQVGSSGYRIDMAIQDPQQTSRFVLGIECDGVAYHSSQTARDRDRLREEVLVGLGWQLHRIWGTAWYRHRQDEQARLKMAIDQALRVKPQGLLARPIKAQARPAVEVEEVVWGETSEWAVPYVVSSPPGPPRNVDPSQASSVPYLRRTIEAVVEQESPVHKDVVDARVRETWGFARIGANIRTQMDAAISSSKNFHVDENGFMYVGTLEGELPTRTHDEWHKRDIKHIHQRELEDTAFRIVREAAAISFDDLVMASARNFGFTRVGPDIRDAIGRAVRSLQESGWITGDDDQRIRLVED